MTHHAPTPRGRRIARLPLAFARRWLGPGFGLLALIAGSSCQDQPAEDGRGRCKSDADCPSDAYCDTGAGVCIVTAFACNEQNGCPDGFVCNLDTLFCEPANDDDPCPEGLVRVDGACVAPECRADADCPLDHVCDGETYRCVDSASIGCASSDECPEPLVCKSGVCRHCSRDADCPPDKRCLVGEGGEPACASFACRGDFDCRDGWWCHAASNACRPPCAAHSDCDSGFACRDNRCILPVPECDTDWDCPDRKLCTPLKLCEPGPACQGDAECGSTRVCAPGDGVCIPGGCFADAECEGGRLCDPGTHECRFASRTGSVCGDSEQCLSTDTCYRNFCRRLCDPYAAQCPEGELCGLVLDSDAGRAPLCLPNVGGAGAGESCTSELSCRHDLICHNFRCLTVCDPMENAPPCGTGEVCLPNEAWGVGLCRTPPCDPETNPCPDELACYEGDCVQCTVDAHCPYRYVCEAGECKTGCVISGCEGINEFCNTQSGRCEGYCSPVCDDGYVCEDGECKPAFCDPPCLAPAQCERGRCILPPDCRISGCPDERWTCNLSTGVCDPPECPVCPPDYCCSDLTDYRCSPVCYTCAPEVEDGSCPSGRLCLEGQCVSIPCVNAGSLCGAVAPLSGTPCCQGAVCCEVFPGSGGVCCTDCDPDGTCRD